MAIMIIFGKELLKWHNMKDISYVLKFFVFNLQGIYFFFFFLQKSSYQKGFMMMLMLNYN